MRWPAYLVLVPLLAACSSSAARPQARPTSPAPAGAPGPAPIAAGSSCMPCSGRALRCTRSGAGGPSVPKLARLTGADAAGCRGMGDPGLFAQDRRHFWYRCGPAQLCIDDASQCYPVQPSPEGFWLNLPGGESLICTVRP